MKIPDPIRTKRILIVFAVLIAGELMPYLSRIPLSFVYGTAWIWDYTPTFDDAVRWNGLHLFTLVPLAVFGLIFIFSTQRSPFIASTLGHFTLTCLLYYSHGKPHGPDDFLGCIVFPFPIALLAGFAGGVTLIAGSLLAARKRRRLALQV